jgi:hypothetical protein
MTYNTFGSEILMDKMQTQGNIHAQEQNNDISSMPIRLG